MPAKNVVRQVYYEEQGWVERLERAVEATGLERPVFIRRALRKAIEEAERAEAAQRS